MSTVPEEIELPVQSVLKDIGAALKESSSLILHAPPGAGKTTLVPLALLNEPWLDGKKIIVLEPRRLAAKAAAMRMSDLLGEEPGLTVGYRTRMDSVVGKSTKIEVLTEGILTRMIQDDPALEGVGLVIFDEFHERSINADLGLALALDIQEIVRQDLRVLVMSATLNSSSLSGLMNNAPIISCQGRSFPVEVRYLESLRQEHLRDSRALCNALSSALAVALREEGDILVFLPGAGEIRMLASEFEKKGVADNVKIMPLYGNLSRDEQKNAILPLKDGKRKLVLATPIAETSLTIEGIKIVLDCGLMRTPRFNPQNGMSSLETIRIGRDSAEQRKGRAGRTAPGLCLRLWSDFEQGALAENRKPEIFDADLAPLMLELALWGTKVADLAWLDVPPEKGLGFARKLLYDLEAIDDKGRITSLGRRMAALPMHPRLAHMVLKAFDKGMGLIASDLAAILGERDMLKGDVCNLDSDIRLRLECLRNDNINSIHGFSLDRGIRTSVIESSRRIRHLLGIIAGDYDLNDAGPVLAFAYPDRIAKRRKEGSGRYLLKNGKGASLISNDSLISEDFIVIATMEGFTGDARIFLAAPLSEGDVKELFRESMEERLTIVWDKERKAVSASSCIMLGSINIEDSRQISASEEAVSRVFLEALRSMGIASIPFGKKALELKKRLEFAGMHNSLFPDFSDRFLTDNVEEWLAPWIRGLSRFDELEKLDFISILRSMIPWDLMQELDVFAPSHISVPSGSKIPVNYDNPGEPFFSVRIQEVFGLLETPVIAGGRVGLLIHLLSPAGRPIQLTRDLSGFWASGYFEVKKELKGRYPKHYWPDDPLVAEARRGVKKN